MNEGIALFDKQDYPAAIEKYREVLKIWPQNGWAYYELAYTMRTQEVIAAGEKPQLPTEGLAVQVNSAVKVPLSPEVKAVYVQSRHHSPFMYAAYVSDEQDVIPAFCAYRKNVTGDKIR